MDERTDEEIAQEVQRGNVETFGTLVERYAERMSRYARRFLLNREDTEDLVQEVFLKAYRNMQSFDTTLRFSPWLYRIAHNEFVSAIRRKARDPLRFFDLDMLFPHPVAKEATQESSERREIRDALERSLADVDPKYREPLVLYYFEEMSYQEIADILHIPVSTVGVRLSRGKTVLKQKYKEHHGPALA